MIIEAIKSKNHDLIKKLVEKGLDLNRPVDQKLPIWFTSSDLDLKTAKLLIDLGANPEKQINFGPNFYDVIVMDHEVGMSRPSKEAKTFIESTRNYYNGKATEPEGELNS